jgi:hypothetical protein
MEVSGQLHIPAALHAGKEPLVPVEAGWVPEQFWTLYTKAAANLKISVADGCSKWYVKLDMSKEHNIYLKDHTLSY